eukprot:TRINITY_DN2894_c2_g1_i1.p1 TRINITY_DN2894_c2_g1~~TRINITY_DN2894_c2_g1_i1.p1  ORF type:complete len:1651 (+),score=378.96 TRINITY_DN2894_c2_g1_i1:80-4954(+)
MTNEETWMRMFNDGQKTAATKLVRSKGGAVVTQRVKSLLPLVYGGGVVCCTKCRADVLNITACAHTCPSANFEIVSCLKKVLHALIDAKGDVAVAGDSLFTMAAAAAMPVPLPVATPTPTPAAAPPPAPARARARTRRDTFPDFPLPGSDVFSSYGGDGGEYDGYGEYADDYREDYGDDYDDGYGDGEDEEFDTSFDSNEEIVIDLDPGRGKYVVIADSAKVRKQQNLNSVVVCDLPRGTIVKVIQKAGNRYFINSPTHGWLSKKASDGSTLVRNLRSCNVSSPEGHQKGRLVTHNNMYGTILVMLSETEAVVKFSQKEPAKVADVSAFQLLPHLQPGDCFKVTTCFSSGSWTFAVGDRGVMTATTTKPGQYGSGCIPTTSKTHPYRDNVALFPKNIEKVEESSFLKLKMKPAAKIKGIPGGPAPYEALQMEKNPEVIIFHVDHRFKATMLVHIWNQMTVCTYPLSILENVPSKLLMDAAVLQPDFRDGEAQWINNVPVHPRGYPIKVKMQKQEVRDVYPKLLCRIQSATLHKAFDDKRRPSGITGLNLLHWGLENHTNAFRRFAPLASLISMDMISFNFNSTTTPREMITTPYDALEGLSFMELVARFGIDQNANGDLRDGRLTKMLLDANLAERYTHMKWSGKNRMTEEKIRQKYFDNKPELLRFLLNNFPALTAMPTRMDLPIVEIYATQKLFTPQRFYVSGNLVGRHLMSTVMGCNFMKIANEVMCPRFSSIGVHEYTPLMSDSMPTDLQTLFARPCSTCSLPQVCHPMCGIDHLSMYTKLEGACGVCNSPKSAHGAQQAVAKQVTRRTNDGQVQTTTRFQKPRAQFTYRHQSMHKFVERTKEHCRVGGITALECMKCNTQHTDFNKRSVQREELMLWAPDRKRNLFMQYDQPSEPGVARSIESTTCLATAQVPFDYEAKYTYNLTVTPRPYQAHAIDWMIDREHGGSPLIKYNAVSFAKPEEGQYYYSDVYGDFRETPFSVNGGLLASEMGMGKTVMSLAVCMVNGPRARGDDCVIPTYDQGILGSKRKRGESFTGGTPKAPKKHVKKRMGGMLMGGTLIITKATLWGQWSKELRDKVGSGVSVVDYHSGIPAAKRSDMPVDEVDFVVTNYDMLGVQKGFEPDGTCPLLNIWWHRILFDEIHFVSNEGTNQAKVTANLRATNRWLLTGTPVQANHSNVIGLARAMYGIRNSDAMLTVTHENLCKWFKSVSLRHGVLQTYTNGTPYLDIPPKTEVSVEISYTAQEMAVYNAARTALVTELGGFQGSKGWWTKWNTVATKLRQLASHFLNVVDPFTTGYDPVAIVGRGPGGSWTAHANNTGSNLPVVSIKHVCDTVLKRLPSGLAEDVRSIITKPSTEFECPICFEQSGENIAITPCGHVFCIGCIVPIATSGHRCPMCRTVLVNETKLTIVEPDSSVAAAPEPVKPTTPVNTKDPGAKGKPEDIFKFLKAKEGSKIKAMISKIKEVREEDPAAKFVIFAQFEQSIHVIETAIQKAGYKSQKIAGAMTQQQRLRATGEFASDETSIAFILTVRSGSCGLNLTSANHVFLMEPCLNPALELQAIGRCHRISQTKPVVAYRFYIQNTIEETLSKAAGGDGSGKVSIMTPKLLADYFRLPVPSL